MAVCVSADNEFPTDEANAVQINQQIVSAFHEHISQLHSNLEKGEELKTLLLPCYVKPAWKIITKLLSQPIKTGVHLDHVIWAGDLFASKRKKYGFFQHLWNQDEPLPVGLTEFFDTSLPFIQKLVLRMPEIFPSEVPILRNEGAVTLSRTQVACLLAANFFGIMPEPQDYLLGGDFNETSFHWLFSESNYNPGFPFCIINYLMRIASTMPQGHVTYRRKVLKTPPDWDNLTTKLSPVTVHAEGFIEDSPAILHADFANEFIGGGVLHGGCVQEEILFVVKPECLVSMMLCPRMLDFEAITIIGAESYAQSFMFAGNYEDLSKRAEDGSIMTQICAMDATVAFSLPPGGQYEKEWSLRDLNKAYIAFCGIPEDIQPLGAVATGNWGCGAFGCNLQLKFLQQWIAASAAGRAMEYYTFKQQLPSVEKITALAGNVDILTVWKAVCSYSKTDRSTNVFDHVLANISKSEQVPEPTPDHSS